MALGGNPCVTAELRTEVWELRPGDAQVAMPRRQRWDSVDKLEGPQTFWVVVTLALSLST